MTAFYRSIAFVALLAACTPPITEKRATPIGDFQMGYNIVVGDKMIKGPVSRDADTALLASKLQSELQTRLGKYEGGKLYHVVTHVDMYVMGRAGIPFLFSPKTALVVSMTVWDDIAQSQLTPKPVQLTLLENTNSRNFLGSGLGQSVVEQIDSMAKSAAFQIENWLRQQHETQNWFDPNVAIPLFNPAGPAQTEGRTQ